MRLQDLPQEVQDELNAQRVLLQEKEKRNDAYNFVVVNTEGTRYFTAHRVCECWNDDKGNYMPFGGGTHWNIRYGAVQWDRRRNPVGEYDYFWTFGKTYVRSANGTSIPEYLGTKKEVLALAKNIGIFNI